MKTVEELQMELRTNHPTVIRGLGRFDAKLTFDERCAILALYLSGVHRRVLAAAFGIDRRTVAHIYNKNSIHYKAVRTKLQELGHQGFLREYLTEEATMRVAKVANDPAVTLADKEWRSKTDGDILPSRKKNRKEGLHIIKPDQCEHTHRIMIQWFDEREQLETGEKLPMGWWYRDMDGNSPEEWFHSGKESLLSSANALKMCEEELMDPL